MALTLADVAASFARSGLLEARRPLTGKELHVLALRARNAGPGSPEATEYEEACEELERERQSVILRDLAELDRESDEQVDMHSIEKLIRCTVALTLEECENPDADANPDDMEWRISACCRLISLLERIEDFRFDFCLTDAQSRLGHLHAMFPDQMRKQHIRMDNRQRLDMVLPNVFKRFAEQFTNARRLEQDLRRHVKHYDKGADIRYETQRFEQPISTAFACSVALEAHFEDRVFADEDATQGAR